MHKMRNKVLLILFVGRRRSVINFYTGKLWIWKGWGGELERNCSSDDGNLMQNQRCIIMPACRKDVEQLFTKRKTKRALLISKQNRKCAQEKCPSKSLTGTL